MNPIRVFFAITLSVLTFFSLPAAELRFIGIPTVQHFVDGAYDWSASVSCKDPVLLQAARVMFWVDAKLDGTGVLAGSIALSPADCEGDILPLRRGFLPPASLVPSVLRAELHRPRIPADAGGPASPDSIKDSVMDVHTLLPGGIGSLLTLRRFCARPKNGEPEWVEVRNVSTESVSLAKVKLEGRALSNTLGPGESFTVIAAGDTTEFRLWQPGARVVTLSSWSSLRNSGDTLRLSFDNGVNAGASVRLILDSIIYGSGVSVREDCASMPREESAGAAHGFGLEGGTQGVAETGEHKTWGPWKRSKGSWSLKVIAPATGRYDVRAYDLDGLQICVVVRNAVGPQSFSFSSGGASSVCPEFQVNPVILQLQPLSAEGAPSVRKILWIAP